MTTSSPPSERPIRRPSARLLFLPVALVVLLLDQLTKSLVLRLLPAGQSWPGPESAIGRLFSFTHVSNTGVSFGMFQGRNELFAVVSLVVVMGLLVYRHRTHDESAWLQLALGLQVGGALGNLTDRVHFGHVVDFLHVKLVPVFNVADSAIVVGVLVLSWHLWRSERLAHEIPADGLPPTPAPAAATVPGAPEPTTGPGPS